MPDDPSSFGLWLGFAVTFWLGTIGVLASIFSTHRKKFIYLAVLLALGGFWCLEGAFRFVHAKKIVAWRPSADLVRGAAYGSALTLVLGAVALVVLRKRIFKRPTAPPVAAANPAPSEAELEPPTPPKLLVNPVHDKQEGRLFLVVQNNGARSAEVQSLIAASVGIARWPTAAVFAKWEESISTTVSLAPGATRRIAVARLEINPKTEEVRWVVPFVNPEGKREVTRATPWGVTEARSHYDRPPEDPKWSQIRVTILTKPPSPTPDIQEFELYGGNASWE